MCYGRDRSWTRTFLDGNFLKKRKFRDGNSIRIIVEPLHVSINEERKKKEFSGFGEEKQFRFLGRTHDCFRPTRSTIGTKGDFCEVRLVFSI